MLTKTFIAAAVLAPALALSSAAFSGPVYQGGPKSPLTTYAPSQTFETNKPYAQALPSARSGNQHKYQGGPKATMPHGPR